MSRRRVFITAASICIGMVILYFLLVVAPVPRNSVMYFARYYGVGTGSVAQLSQAYGVDAKDISTFGDWPFPVNYIVRQLGWHENGAKELVHKEDVTRAVKGYMSRCELDLTNQERIFYLFYSKRLIASYPFQERALVVGFDFYPDGTLFGIALYDPSGESGARPNDDWHNIAQKCTPPAESGD